MKAAEIAKLLQERTKLTTKISIENFLKHKGKEADWEKTTKSRELFEQLKAQELDGRICAKQARRLAREGHPGALSLRRSFIQLFTTSKICLGITSTGTGKRDSGLQSDFREKLVCRSNSKHPDTRRKFLWCPVLKDWFVEELTTAAQLFAYMHGQEVMDALFGPMNPPELFAPQNGILLCSLVEKFMDKGLLVIVPRLPNKPSAAQISLWNSSEPKNYKVKIIDFAHPLIDDYIRGGSEQTWRDLDDTELVFRSDFRPRARYLYFHYCVQILRVSWKEKHTGALLKGEIGKIYWGTPGRYLPRNMLLALVEETGHEYEHLLEGALEESMGATAEPNDILLAAANDEVKIQANELEEEDDDEDKDEDEDEEESNDRRNDED